MGLIKIAWVDLDNAFNFLSIMGDGKGEKEEKVWFVPVIGAAWL